jgi:NAD(P) transhydrogenase subunit beta
MNMDLIINFSYVVSAILFVFGLKMLSSPATARKGNLLSAVGMLLAIVVTLLYAGLDYKWIALGVAIGSVVGVVAAYRVQMTSMPEMVALFNGFGGLASLLLAWAEYHQTGELSTFIAVVTMLTVFIGGVTFSGSMIAFAKLAELISSKAVIFKGQHIVNGAILLGALAAGIAFVMAPASNYPVFIFMAVVALLFGITSVIPIGGADMPVVISLLNSYSGLAACAAGFVVNNNILIVAGALVGASGIILTKIMCKAMNRSLANVLFGTMGPTADTPDADEVYKTVKAASADEVAMTLDVAQRVVIVPGYGMAVAQAQHAVRDIANFLEAKGITVEYAIHPVAGRMPGHMNVLLAEADVPYEQLKEMDEINPTMGQVDVAIVVGANDVVNPVARTDPKSPIAGMPIIDVDKARTVVVVKRSLSPGFAGIPNPLFAADNTLMFFSDGKKAMLELLAALKEA